jgi:drug/metabolite transporter (DMT)-like permease
MTPLRANGLALTAAFAWGLGNVSQKTIMNHLDGFSATGLSCIMGVIVLLPFVRREARVNSPDNTGLLAMAINVSLLFALAATLMQFGYGHTSVTNAGFMVNTAAVMTPAIASLCFKQALPKWIWSASLCSLLGVFLMAGGSWSGLSFGDGLCLLAALAFAFWTVLLGLHVTRYRRPNMMTALQLLICGAMCLVLGGLTYGPPKPQAILAALPELVVLGVLSKGLAYVLNATAQQYVSATCAAVIMSAEAVFGSIAAMLFLGESLSVARGLGAALIIVGVVIVSCLPVATPVAAKHGREQRQ